MHFHTKTEIMTIYKWKPVSFFTLKKKILGTVPFDISAISVTVCLALTSYQDSTFPNAGQKWLKNPTGTVFLKDMPQDYRSVWEQFNKLLKGYTNKKNNKEEQAICTAPNPPTENEVMLEENH